jgi:hypothetical protein
MQFFAKPATRNGGHFCAEISPLKNADLVVMQRKNVPHSALQVLQKTALYHNPPPA